MILRRLKSKDSVNLLIFPFIALVFWLKDLLVPESYDFYPAENENVLFAPLYGLVDGTPFLQVAVSLVVVILLGFLMQLVNDRYMFIRIRSKLPASLFMIILAGFTGMHTLHPVYFGAVFLMVAISRLFSIFEKAKPYSAVFDVGFWLGMGTLFYFNLVVLLPAFLIGVLVLTRETRWREYLILILGLVVPLLFAWSFYFFFGKAEVITEVFYKSTMTPVNHFRTNFALHGYLSLLILFTILASVDILRQYDSKKVSSRKYFLVFFLIFIFSMVSFAFIPATSQEMLVISAIPVTYLISNFFVFMKRRFWSELLFYLLLGAVVLMQFIG